MYLHFVHSLSCEIYFRKEWKEVSPVLGSCKNVVLVGRSHLVRSVIPGQKRKNRDDSTNLQPEQFIFDYHENELLLKVKINDYSPLTSFSTGLHYTRSAFYPSAIL